MIMISRETKKQYVLELNDKARTMLSAMSLVLLTLSFSRPFVPFLPEDLQLKDQKSYSMKNYLKYAKVPLRSNNGGFIKNLTN